jgi:hypothetical protein
MVSFCAAVKDLCEDSGGITCPPVAKIR